MVYHQLDSRIREGVRFPEARGQPRTAFVTGAAGFVGSFLIDRLLRDGWHVIALARGTDAMARVRAALQNVGGKLLPINGNELRVISADVRDPLLGLQEAAAEELAKGVDALWHCAANFGAAGGGDTPFNVNVTGTQNLLDFASRCNRHRRVPFYYVSTAFAGDCHGGVGHEEPPIAGVSGRNEYECSKREAERLVLNWKTKNIFPAAIFRPSIILGHARTGRAAGFAAYYDFVRCLCAVARKARSGRTDATIRVRSHPDFRVNFVTIDFVIDAMCGLAESPLGDDSIFNIVNESPVSVGAVLAVLCRSFGLTRIELVDETAFAQLPMTRYERLFHAMIGFERLYLEREVLFDNSRFRRVVPRQILPAPRIDAPLLRRINRGYRDHCERQAVENNARRHSPLEVGSPQVAAG